MTGQRIKSAQTRPVFRQLDRRKHSRLHENHASLEQIDLELASEPQVQIPWKIRRAAYAQQEAGQEALGLHVPVILNSLSYKGGWSSGNK